MTVKKRKQIIWMGPTLDTVRMFPESVRQQAGFALFEAQRGVQHRSAVPMKGFGDAKVIEIALRGDGTAFRTIYTVRFEDAVYVLDAFQKKSKRGIATPRSILARIRKRLKEAETLSKERLERKEPDE